MRTLLAIACACILVAVPAWADQFSVTQDEWVTAQTALSFPDGTDFGVMPESTVTITRITFDFEQFDTGLVYGPGEYVEANVDVAGIGLVTMRVERPDSFFMFTDLSEFSESGPLGGPDGVPDNWGSRSLDPFVDMFNPAGFRFTLILPTGYSLVLASGQMGDFSPSDKDDWYFDGEPGVFDNNAGTPLGAELFPTVEVSGIRRIWGDPWSNPAPSNIQYAHAGGGGPEQPGSLFWDNITFDVVDVDDMPIVTWAPAVYDPSNSLYGPGYVPGASPQPIPEPGSILLIGVGFAILVVRSRRR